MGLRIDNMATLFVELLERLKGLDEVTVLELLDISAEDLVDRFEDIIENRQEYIRTQLYDENEEDVDF